ncbi:MAG: hypothetical protein Q9226_002512 [Calogaya cf. arnoldii]
MVVIRPGATRALLAYSTAPLTAEMNRTVQHSFYNGTYARYGDPQATVTIHDRLDFHGRSHYDMRNILDAEGMEDTFVVVDERTPVLDAVWYVMDTWYSKFREEEEVDLPGAIIKYPDEDFTLWHAHMHTEDVPLQAPSWADGCSKMAEMMHSYLDPHDPHDPQDEVISLDIDWTDPEAAVIEWGSVHLTAISGIEVEWSTDIHHRRIIYLAAPVVARLNAEAAKESGLLQSWFWQERILPPGEVVQLMADYDAKNPVWPGFPDDQSTRTDPASTPRGRLNTKSRMRDRLVLPATQRRVHHQNACRRARLRRPGKPKKFTSTVKV